jgi:iron(III) transport system substrate-binding protein
MARIRRRIIPQILLALAALSVALPLALVGCGGGDQSPFPAATSPASPTAAPATTGASTQTQPTVAPTQPEEREDRTLTVYSGRSQSLVHPLLEAFGEYTGISIRVKYGGSASTAATLLEEGDNTPADVVFLQDPGSLGSLAASGMLAALPQDTLDKVDSRLRDPNGRWIGTSGRARTVIYNTESINPDTDLPESILDFTQEEWKGRVGWAPRNGSFQSFVTALRLQVGEDGARQWLEGMKDNDAQEYPNNVSIVQAAANREVDVGFVNHYYLERFLAEHGPEFEARNYYIGNGDPGALVLVAGAGILEASENKETALEFVEFLLSEPAQVYFTSDVKEYPVSSGVVPEGDLPPLESLDPPDVDLGSLSDLQGTLNLLRDVGVLP